MQKIYCYDKALVLTDNADAFIRDYPDAAGYLRVKGASIAQYQRLIQALRKPDAKGALIEDVSEEVLRQPLFQAFPPIAAGGGLVLNESGSVLMIHRRGHWDLPKGKQDEGEDIATCALREVREETGLSQLRIGDEICESFHVYRQDNQDLIKHTTWFMMYATGAEKLVPQQEEDIHEARWVEPGQLASITEDTYDTIRDVLREAGLL